MEKRVRYCFPLVVFSVSVDPAVIPLYLDRDAGRGSLQFRAFDVGEVFVLSFLVAASGAIAVVCSGHSGFLRVFS